MQEVVFDMVKSHAKSISHLHAMQSVSPEVFMTSIRPNLAAFFLAVSSVFLLFLPLDSANAAVLSDPISSPINGHTDAGHEVSSFWASVEPVTYANRSLGQANHARSNGYYAQTYTIKVSGVNALGKGIVSDDPYSGGIVVAAVPEPVEWPEKLLLFGLVVYLVSRKTALRKNRV